MMKINISEIAEKIGQEIDFEFVEKAESIGAVLQDCKLSGPIMVKGIATNTGTCFRLQGEVNCSLICVCDRCLDDFTTTGNYSFVEEYTKDEALSKTENMNYFNGDIIDIGDLVRDIIILSQPVKYLCSEDCKGLCKVCGANLNKTECGCNRESIDPRLAALQNLLKKK